MSGRLILLCGLAGAGKTTLAKQLEAEGAVRMCPDEWLLALGFDIYDKDARVAVEALQWDLAQALVLRGLTVVDECGVWQRWERDLRRTWAREHGVPVELRFLDAPVEVLTERVAERNGNLPAGAPRIDPALVAFWDDRIDRPDPEELALFDSPADSWPAPTDGVAEHEALWRRAAAYVLCRDGRGRILLTRFFVEGHPDSGRWTMPGGAMEWGETAEETALRELEEETGLRARLGSVVGVYSHWLAAEESVRGEPGHVIGVVYEGNDLTGELRTSFDAGTTDAAAWFSMDELASLPRVGLVDFVLSRIA